MKRRLITLIVLSVLLVGAGYAAAFIKAARAWAPWCLAVGTTALLMALTALGATRRDTLATVLRLTFVAIFVLCAGAFCIALALAANEGDAGPLLLGLPLRTALVLFGVGVVPIAVLPFVYAATFDAFTLSDADLARLRSECAALRAARPAPE